MKKPVQYGYPHREYVVWLCLSEPDHRNHWLPTFSQSFILCINSPFCLCFSAAMPTVLLLDVSLSMSRPVPAADDSEAYTRRQLAIRAINAFLDHLEQNCKLEFVSLVWDAFYYHFTHWLMVLLEALISP